jgi:hypothetical protein
MKSGAERWTLALHGAFGVLLGVAFWVLLIMAAYLYLFFLTREAK